ncbi:MAG: IS1 family transposase [Saprospiraceae bacterium]
MILCPDCHSHKVKKNGFTYYGKQNHKCKDCKRQFVLDNHHTVGEAKREIARRALGERLSLRGICRVVGVSLRWICGFAAETWATAPEDLGLCTESNLLRSSKVLKIIGLQLDEAWSFVGCKKNKAWIWVAFEPNTRQVVAFHIGGRGIDSAKALWLKIPQRMRKHCYFETDEWEAYRSVLPFDRHYVGKDQTYHVKGFWSGVRARVSRLVRKSLSFSKNWDNHIAAIRYYFWQFNLERQPYI